VKHRCPVAAAVLAVAIATTLAGCGTPEERAAKYITNAQQLFDAKDYDKARIEAQNAAQINPKNADARFLLAKIAEEQKEYQQMFGHLTVVVDEAPTNVEARLKLATLYFLGQAWEQAREQVATLMEQAPNDARVRLLYARTLIQKGEQAQGIAEIDAALKLDPDNVEGILLQSSAMAIESLDKGIANVDAAIARLPAEAVRPLRELRVVMLSQAKRAPEVETDLEALARDFPKEDAYQFQLARFYQSQGRVDDAEKLLKGVAERDPEDTTKTLGYVQFLATQKDLDQAEAALKTFIGERPDDNKLKLALAELYERTKRGEDARQTYAAVAGAAPKTAEGYVARNRLAAIAVQAGKIDEGKALLEGILTDAPDESQALLLRAAIRAADNQLPDAIADLRLVLRKDDKNVKALLLLGQAYAQTKDLALAKDTYRRLLEVEPDSADGLLQLSALLAGEKDLAGAEDLLRKRLEKQPDDILASGRLVELLLAQKQADKAEAEARRMAALNNQTGVGDFQLARVLAQKQDFAGAAAAFRKSVDSRVGDPLPLQGLVQSLVAQGKSGEAINVLNDKVAANKDDLFAKFLLAGIYGREGDQKNAERYLEDVIKQKPDAVVAYASLAGLYKTDREARIRVYQRGLKQLPGNPELSMLLGTEYEQSGRSDDAIGVYEALVKANPKYEPGINNLAASLLDTRTDKASWQRALELSRPLENTGNPAMMDTLGWAFHRNGETTRAVALLEQAVAKAPQVPVFRYHLGMAYVAAGNPVGAKQELEKALAAVSADTPWRAEVTTTLAKL
jgi:tetratricopeptide (TPR) repeat protein